MKILQINAVYGVGSTGVIVKDIHKMSLNSGIDSYVAYSTTSDPIDDIHNGYCIGNVIGKKLHALFSRINGMQGYFSRYATCKLLKYIKNLNPDIVQLHNLHSNYINLNMLLKFLAKENIKTIITLHDCWFFTGGCFHYTAAGCNRWLKECGNCPKKKSDTKSTFLDRSAKILSDRKKYLTAINNLTVVGVSNWIADETRRTFLEDKEIVTIHNGVDTNFFKPTLSEFREKNGLTDKFVILGLASKFLAPINKEIFKCILSALKDDEALVLLGCTDEQQKTLPEKVIPLPFIKDKDELIKIYSAADVFVNCTREDTFPLANLEPQSCGTPVITFDATGAKETVDNCCGFSVEAGNVDKLIERIKDVKKLSKHALTADCRNWAISSFNKEDNYKKYIELYTEIYSR